MSAGVVYWTPPESAVAAAQQACITPRAHSYGPSLGAQGLLEALQTKVREENGLTSVRVPHVQYSCETRQGACYDCTKLLSMHFEEPETNLFWAQASPQGFLRSASFTQIRNSVPSMQVDIMVTSGANQAFTNIVLTLVDAEDQVVLFKPYYFNHLMACQMTGGDKNVLYGTAGAGLKPDLDWLETTLKVDKPPKMVVIVNPCNPAGSVFLLFANSAISLLSSQQVTACSTKYYSA